jgi:hypothetical protein
MLCDIVVLQNVSFFRLPNNRMFRFSGEIEREPVTLLLLDVNKATLHLISSPTFTGLVQQCRREPPPTHFFCPSRQDQYVGDLVSGVSCTPATLVNQHVETYPLNVSMNMHESDHTSVLLKG